MFEKLHNWIIDRLISRKSRSVYGWSKVRDQHIANNPRCAICGYTSFQNDVHHIVPRHIDVTRVFDPDNLITLCRKYSCHLRFGHFGNYTKYWNPKIKEFAYLGQQMENIEVEQKSKQD